MDTRITLRLRPEELEQFKDEADKSGLPPSTFIKLMALRGMQSSELQKMRDEDEETRIRERAVMRKIYELVAVQFAPDGKEREASTSAKEAFFSIFPDDPRAVFESEKKQ